jgi:hypothetical protein
MTGIGLDSLCRVWERIFLLPAATSDHCVTVLSLWGTSTFKLPILFLGLLPSLNGVVAGGVANSCFAGGVAHLCLAGEVASFGFC